MAAFGWTVVSIIIALQCIRDIDGIVEWWRERSTPSWRLALRPAPKTPIVAWWNWRQAGWSALRMLVSFVLVPCLLGGSILVAQWLGLIHIPTAAEARRPPIECFDNPKPSYCPRLPG